MVALLRMRRLSADNRWVCSSGDAALLSAAEGGTRPVCGTVCGMAYVSLCRQRIGSAYIVDGKERLYVREGGDGALCVCISLW